MYIDSSNLISIQICTYENLEKCQILSYKNQKYYGKCICNRNPLMRSFVRQDMLSGIFKSQEKDTQIRSRSVIIKNSQGKAKKLWNIFCNK